MIIQPITTLEQVCQVQQTDIAIWGNVPGETVPIHVLRTVVENGGLLLGAFIDEKMIGFTLGWLGTTDAASPWQAAEHLKLASHMTGVLSGYRDRQVGYRLKLAQREWAIERGLELITWTYDPLESRNARLNMRRLGATCQTYLQNVYSAMADPMNAGIASDRFQVDWRINSVRVRERLASSTLPHSPAGERAQLLNPATLGPDGYPRPAERPALPSGARLLVEIPVDMQAIRQADLALGIAWREHTRAIFWSAFADGYQVTDFIYERDSSPPHSFYLLEKKEAYTNED